MHATVPLAFGLCEQRVDPGLSEQRQKHSLAHAMRLSIQGLNTASSQQGRLQQQGGGFFAGEPCFVVEKLRCRFTFHAQGASAEQARLEDIALQCLAAFRDKPITLDQQSHGLIEAGAVWNIGHVSLL